MKFILFYWLYWNYYLECLCEKNECLEICVMHIMCCAVLYVCLCVCFVWVVGVVVGGGGGEEGVINSLL